MTDSSRSSIAHEAVSFESKARMIENTKGGGQDEDVRNSR